MTASTSRVTFLFFIFPRRQRAPRIARIRRLPAGACSDAAARDRYASFGYASLGSILGNVSAHADGKRGGLDRIGGWHWKGLGETRLQVQFRSAGAVGVGRRHAPRCFKENISRTRRRSARLRRAKLQAAGGPAIRPAEPRIFFPARYLGACRRRTPTARAERGRYTNAAARRQAFLNGYLHLMSSSVFDATEHADGERRRPIRPEVYPKTRLAETFPTPSFDLI